MIRLQTVLNAHTTDGTVYTLIVPVPYPVAMNLTEAYDEEYFQYETTLTCD